MRIIKKGESFPIRITDEDITITNREKFGENLKDVLDEHQADIEKLKSNVKYLYSYGGVGGTGSGSGGGQSSGDASLYISLAGHQLTNGGTSIVLGEIGRYELSGNVRNSGGKTYYVRGNIGTTSFSFKLGDGTYRFTSEYSLQRNGEIVVSFDDEDGNTLETIRQNFIVTPHMFNVSFKYKYPGGIGTFPESNECFINDTSRTDPFIEISYRIDLPNVSNVRVECSIPNVGGIPDLNKSENPPDITKSPFMISLADLTKGSGKLMDNSNTGSYDVSATLSYSYAGNQIRQTLSFTFVLIPSGLYIHVRNPQDKIYGTFGDLIDAKNNGTQEGDETGIPEKNVVEGTYVSFYCKVYEGSIESTRLQYTVECKAYEYAGSPDEEYDEFSFNPDPVYSDTLTMSEQVESPKPFSFAFGKSGIKKIVFRTNPLKQSEDSRPTVVYLYVRKSSSKLEWFPGGDAFEVQQAYFRANEGYLNFPELPSKLLPLEMKVSDKSVLTLTGFSFPSRGETTVLSLGIQYSKINSEGVKILEAYTYTDNTATPDITMYANHIFNNDAEDLCVPYDENYDSSVMSQYHLLQIVRTPIGNSGDNKYATIVYIDGIPESINNSPADAPWTVNKIVLNNVNVSYNLIGIHYMTLGQYTIDQVVYQYYLKFKERMCGLVISQQEQKILEQMEGIRFDGTNVIVSKSTIESYCNYMKIPSIVLSYGNDDKPLTDTEITNFENILFKGYGNGDNGAFDANINLFWCDGVKDDRIADGLKKIDVPKFTIENVGEFTGSWHLNLQGTSTMRNRIKNFQLSIQTVGPDGSQGKILVSPNYDSANPETFLPENAWTLKADIADSAHANNTSVGMFVNRVCTKFNTGLKYGENTKKYIKNTLEGFPVMMYFRIGGDDHIYYFGVYNFNLGRSSYYNLGYYGPEDTESMIQHISDQGSTFKFSWGDASLYKDLSIAEIQENLPRFDFHQFDEKNLFQNSTSNVVKMFGTDSKITYGTDIQNAKKTLKNFVKSVALAGGYCFANVGKEFIPSSYDQTGHTGDCVDRYDVGDKYGSVPAPEWQMTYSDDDKISWSYDNDFTRDSLVNKMEALYECIGTRYNNVDITPTLDYVSASEYYTICMAFALIDSVLKNMNIKSWNGITNFIAFYDMDCAFGEDNAGNENVSYMAAMDYWHSEESGGYLNPVKIEWDYWNNAVGKGFDFKSSYLFAIVKYAQAILNKTNKNNEDAFNLSHYPQEFWAELRKPEGELRSASFFMDKYFKSGIGSIPAYMAALNYQVKYFYKGEVLDGNNTSITSLLANASAFHGSRIFRVKDWLNRRIHFLDVMFNVQNVNIGVYPDGEIYVPMVNDELKTAVSMNSDVTILQDAFSEATGQNTSLIASSGVIVNIYAPTNTPMISIVGGTPEIYILSKGIGNPNPIMVNIPQPSITSRCLGSKEFTSVSMVETFFTNACEVISDRIEDIIYGGSTLNFNSAFKIISSSVKNIQMNIPGFVGTLNIDTDGLHGQSVNTLNVSGSGFYGDWSNLGDLQYLNISSVSATSQDIKIGNSKLLKGENCVISGTAGKLTSLASLQMNDVSGTFNIENTSIQSISISAIDGEYASFTIKGDKRLTSLSLTGFERIDISGCPNLKSLTVTEGEVNKCKEFLLDFPANYSDYISDDPLKKYVPPMTQFPTGVSGHEKIFDFTGFDNLELLGLSGCYGVEVIKIPNRKVEITTFSNNVDLEFVDTEGENSYIVLTGGYSFYECPCYGMQQSVGDDSSYNFTKMKISATCSTLAHTFDKLYDIKSKYLVDGYDTVDLNGKPSKKKNISLNNNCACHFLNSVVDTDRQKNIIDLSACFKSQGEIFYIGEKDQTIPDLSGYTSLTEVAEMYAGTGVNYLDSRILSFPYELNMNESPIINWDRFVRYGQMNMSIDALKNISYRIDGLSSMTASIYSVGENGKGELMGRNDSEYIDILDVLSVRTDDDGNKIPFEKITSFSGFSIDSSQYVDYTGLMPCCPNLRILNGFLIGNLTRVKMDGMLKSCENLTSIYNSFNHSGDVSDLKQIDLYELFNWGKNLELTNMFNSENGKTVGFRLNKVISWDHFRELMDVLPKYRNLTSLANIFSHCIITGYDGSDIMFGEKMEKIVSTDCMFYMCSGTGNNGADVPLHIGRSFFGKLPNVVSMMNMFYGVHFGNPLSYDFFSKKTARTEDVYVDSSASETTTFTNNNYYGSTPITSLYNCFRNVKFVNCKCWFDPDDNEGILINDAVGNGSTTYYRREAGALKEYSITKPVAVKDTENNYTNYILNPSLPALNGDTTSTIFRNHDIRSDLSTFSNISETDGLYPFDLSSASGITSCMCCLPPDIFYACSSMCDLSGVFADTNICGVLPQHMMMNCREGIYRDMFLNTNIMPNVCYHFDDTYEGDALTAYKEMIKDVPIDEEFVKNILNTDDGRNVLNFNGIIDGTSDDAVVLFRNSDGELRRRRKLDTFRKKKDDLGMNPETDTLYDYPKSQFVYVPNGFATNKNLDSAFTFRYNIPSINVLNRTLLENEDGLNIYGWPETGNNECDPINAPYLWPHYVQYFMMSDRSVTWENIMTVTSPFITNSGDRDMITGQVRLFSSSQSSDYKWVDGDTTITRTTWINKTNGIFNLFLDLCGTLDRTGELKNNGCLVKKSIDARMNPNLSSFISGYLLTFLNGKIFDVTVNNLNSTNGSGLINVGTYCRNVMLPQLASVMKDYKGILTGITRDVSCLFEYEFISGSMANYTDSQMYGDVLRQVIYSGTPEYHKYTVLNG